MSTTTTPVYTAGTAGALDSGSLAASANRSFEFDVSVKFEGQLHVKNTPGGSIDTTRGVRVEIFRKYGATPTTGESAFLTYTLPSLTASTAESLDVFLGPGKYSIKITNLDAANAVTVDSTGDLISSLLNT